MFTAIKWEEFNCFWQFWGLEMRSKRHRTGLPTTLQGWCKTSSGDRCHHSLAETSTGEVPALRQIHPHLDYFSPSVCSNDSILHKASRLHHWADLSIRLEPFLSQDTAVNTEEGQQRSVVNPSKRGRRQVKTSVPEFDTSSMSLPSRISSSFWAAETAQFTPSRQRGLYATWLCSQWEKKQ